MDIDEYLPIFILAIIVSVVWLLKRKKTQAGFLGWCFVWYFGATYLSGTIFILLTPDGPHALPLNWITFFFSPALPIFIPKLLSTEKALTIDLILFFSLSPIVYLSGLLYYFRKLHILEKKLPTVAQ